MSSPYVFFSSKDCGTVRTPDDDAVLRHAFSLADKFVVRALDHMLTSGGYVAFLLRLSFLEGGRRWRAIFHDRPPTVVHVFSERVTMYPNGLKTGAGGTTAYCWFVWRKGPHEGIRWIQPGARRENVG